MYLTKIRFDLNSQESFRNASDAQAMHRIVTRAFKSQRKDKNILWTSNIQDGQMNIYTYSDTPVADSRRKSRGVEVVGERDVSDWLAGMKEGQMWRFELKTMPFRKVKSIDAKHSRRRAIRSRDERLLWLKEKGKQNGFAILTTDEVAVDKVFASHTEERGGAMFYDSYTYHGVLQITDTEKFLNAVKTGIGAGKAYGMGMLILSPKE